MRNWAEADRQANAQATARRRSHPVPGHPTIAARQERRSWQLRRPPL